MRYLTVFLAVAFTAGAQVLFQDDFSDGDDQGWSRRGNASFDVVGQRYIIYSSGAQGLGFSLNGDDQGLMSTADYTVLCTVEMETPAEAGIICRYAQNDWYYRLVMQPLSNTLALERTGSGSATMTLDEAAADIDYGETYFLRMQVAGDTISGRFWAGSLQDEPDYWMVHDQDGVQQEPGSFGLFGSGYGKVSWSMIFDDVTVSTPVQQYLEAFTWAGVKAAEF